MLCLFLTKIAAGQNENIVFKHIGIRDGLSQSSVISFLQDSKGFLWIGTIDGLNRYDGYNFNVFKYDKYDSTSVIGNMVRSMYQSNDGTIWIGTTGSGVCSYNSKTQKFKWYVKDAASNFKFGYRIRAINEDKQGLIWVATERDGVVIINPQSGVFDFLTKHTDTLTSSYTTSLIFATDGTYWIGTRNGLNRYDPQTKKVQHFFSQSSPNSLPHNFIETLFEARDGTLWIGTHGGLCQYNPDNKTFTSYVHDNKNQYSLSNNIVQVIYEDAANVLWIGTLDGLNIFNRSTQQFRVFRNDPQNPYSIVNNNISAIYEDQAGIIWIGTWERGISYYDRNAKKFQLYNYQSGVENTFPSLTVRSVFEDLDQTWWIGYLGGGMVHYNPKTNDITKYPIINNNQNVVHDNTVSAFCRDSKNRLWIGTWRAGLFLAVFDKDKIIRFERYSKEYDGLISNSIAQIFEDSKQRIWIATEHGIEIFNPDTKKIEHIVIQKAFQHALVEDKKGNIWAGAWHGLYKFSTLPDGSIKTIVYKNNGINFQSLPDNRVISLCIDDDQNLWAGTFGSGICKIIPQENDSIVCTNYTERHGLSSNVVYGIFSGNDSCIWASTNKGISRMNPRTRKIATYDENDGLQSNAFVWGAAYKSADGRLFFGGIGGLNVFMPNQVKDNKYSPPIVLTDFKMFNTSVSIGEGSRLQKAISETDTIHLYPNDKVISFEFSALHFSVPENNQYAYQLEGFNRDWIYTQANNRLATYTNLDAGTYTFKVKGSNSDGVWNNDGVSVTIIVHPPFWQTWWFRVLSVFAFVSLTFALYRMRIRNVEAQKLVLEQQVNERTVELKTEKQKLEYAYDQLEQKSTEIQAQSEKLELYAKELEQLSIVASETDNAVTIMDAQGHFLWFNEGFTRLYGYTGEEFKSKYPTVFDVSNNPDINKTITRCIETRQSVIYETSGTTKNGEELWIQTTITPILDINNEIEKLVAIDADIKKLKQAEQEIRIKNDQITGSIRYAQRIQRAILPIKSQIDLYFENFIIYRPKDIVSGDFYWFSVVEQDNRKMFFLAVADCTGHGVPGAFMSMIGSRLLNEIVNELRIHNTSQILEALNNSTYKALQQQESDNNDGMDISVCRIEQVQDGYEVQFSGAKRAGFYVDVVSKNLFDMEADRRSIGGVRSHTEKMPFSERSYFLHKGSTLYFYSDGFVDQNNKQRKRFGTSFFKHLVIENQQLPLADMQKILENSLDNWIKDEEQRDDITVWGVRL